jgi:hypothetical protein
MAEKDRPSGLILTDEGGNYYYLRPEVLAQARMPEEEVEKLKAGLAAATSKDRELSLDEMQTVAGGIMNTTTTSSLRTLPSIQSLGAIKVGGGGSTGIGNLNLVTSTVMCPW